MGSFGDPSNSNVTPSMFKPWEQMARPFAPGPAQPMNAPPSPAGPAGSAYESANNYLQGQFQTPQSPDFNAIHSQTQSRLAQMLGPAPTPPQQSTTLDKVGAGFNDVFSSLGQIAQGMKPGSVRTPIQPPRAMERLQAKDKASQEQFQQNQRARGMTIAQMTPAMERGEVDQFNKQQDTKMDAASKIIAAYHQKAQNPTRAQKSLEFLANMYSGDEDKWPSDDEAIQTIIAGTDGAYTAVEARSLLGVLQRAGAGIRSTIDYKGDLGKKAAVGAEDTRRGTESAGGGSISQGNKKTEFISELYRSEVKGIQDDPLNIGNPARQRQQEDEAYARITARAEKIYGKASTSKPSKGSVTGTDPIEGATGEEEFLPPPGDEQPGDPSTNATGGKRIKLPPGVKDLDSLQDRLLEASEALLKAKTTGKGLRALFRKYEDVIQLSPDDYTTDQELKEVTDKVIDMLMKHAEEEEE